MTLATKTKTQTFVIALIFKAPDLSPLLDDIKAAASHIPRYWDVSEADRQLIKTLFEKPVTRGGSMRVSMDLLVTPAEHAHYSQLFKEVAAKCDSKTFIALNMKNPSFFCLHAYGGTKEDVVSSMEALLLENDLPPPQQADDTSLQAILDAAEQHGSDSDPDHEVGDLQDLLRAAWGLMTPEQRIALLQSDCTTQIFEANGEDNPFDDAESESASPATPGN